MSLKKERENLYEKGDNWLSRDNGADNKKNSNLNKSWKYWILLGVLAQYKIIGVIKNKLNRVFFENIGCIIFYKSNKSDI